MSRNAVTACLVAVVAVLATFAAAHADQPMTPFPSPMTAPTSRGSGGNAISGSSVAPRVAVFSGATTLSGYSGFTYDPTPALSSADSVTITGNQAASSAHNDVVINTAATRTSGNVFVVENNGTPAISVAPNGSLYGTGPAAGGVDSASFIDGTGVSGHVALTKQQFMGTGNGCVSPCGQQYLTIEGQLGALYNGVHGDVTVNTLNLRTAGFLFQVANQGASEVLVDFAGNITQMGPTFTLGNLNAATIACGGNAGCKIDTGASSLELSTGLIVDTGAISSASGINLTLTAGGAGLLRLQNGSGGFANLLDAAGNTQGQIQTFAGGVALLGGSNQQGGLVEVVSSSGAGDVEVYTASKGATASVFRVGDDGFSGGAELFQVFGEGLTKHPAQSVSCSSGTAALDPQSSSVWVTTHGASCVVTLAKTTAGAIVSNVQNSGDVTIQVVDDPGGGHIVTFPNVVNTHIGPTSCTTTGLAKQGGSYTVEYNGVNASWYGKSCVDGS